MLRWIWRNHEPAERDELLADGCTLVLAEASERDQGGHVRTRMALRDPVRPVAALNDDQRRLGELSHGGDLG